MDVGANPPLPNTERVNWLVLKKFWAKLLLTYFLFNSNLNSNLFNSLIQFKSFSSVWILLYRSLSIRRKEIHWHCMIIALYFFLSWPIHEMIQKQPPPPPGKPFFLWFFVLLALELNCDKKAYRMVIVINWHC